MSSRYRLIPTPEQEQGFRIHCGHVRLLWNLCLEQFNWYSWRCGPTPSSIDQIKQLPELRAEYPWLAEGSSSVQQTAIRDFGQACQNWWRGTHGRPKFKKHKRKEGFCVRDVKVRYCPSNRKRAWIQVPKVGWVEFKLSRPLPEDQQGMARITQDGKGRWHVSFPAQQRPIERKKTGKQIALDLGVTTTIFASDGQSWRAPEMSKRKQRRLVALQQKLERQQKGSAAREQTKRQISAIHQEQKDRIKNWVEVMTTRLVREYDLVALEDLKIQNMTKRPAPRPSEEAEGQFEPNGAAAKAGLNRSILAQCWGLFALRLTQKAEASGVDFVKVNPKNTSRSCHECGHTTKENRESQAVFKCKECGHTDHADKNAAKNILARALEIVQLPVAQLPPVLAQTPG